MSELINSLLSYFQQGGPWMIALFLCSLWTWAIYAAYVLPMAKGKGGVQLAYDYRQIKQARHTLTILAMVAPLIGLLGTVSGMISAFKVLSSWGVVHPRQLASAISEALLTTQAGLTVAVPAMLGAHILHQGIERIGIKR